MKERLHGLLALVLCMAMAFSPVSGALADGNPPCVVYTREGPFSDESIQLGDLIQSNVSLTSNASGGEVRYYEGLYGDEAEYKKDIAENYLDSIIIEETENKAEYKQNHWMVAKKGNTEYTDGWIALERVGRFVGQQELDDNRILLTMRSLQTVDSINITIDQRKAKLKSAAENAGYDAGIDFYQMSIYDKDTPVNNVMRRSENQSLRSFVTIRLFYPMGYNRNNSTPDDYALFHLRSDGSIERLPVSLDSDSINVQVDEFSPYALAYKPLKNDGVPDGEGDDPDGNQTGGLPQTGDNSRLALWFAFACAALAGLAAIRIRRRKYIG